MSGQPNTTNFYYWDLLNQSSSDLKEAVIQSLGAFKPEPVSLPLKGPSSAVLVVFDLIGVTEEMLDQVSTLVDSHHLVIGLVVNSSEVPHFKYWNLLQSGFRDLIEFKPGLPLESIITAKIKRWYTLTSLVHSDDVSSVLIGQSETWNRTLKHVVEVAYFCSAPVLILGESGCGKELVARMIHQLDRRQGKRDLVLVDCSTLSPELGGSEFFGHEKGAFTGAISTRDGAFMLADKGSLFLDEIGELPPRLQAELLRVSQEKTFKRIGSNLWQNTDFRLICATNRDLHDDSDKGVFRKDLLYRIQSCVIELPSLADRRIDIPILAQHFFKSVLGNKELPEISPQVMKFLMLRDYPGNIRELRQVVARIAYRYCGTGPITIGDIPDFERQRHSELAEDWQSDELEKAVELAVSNMVGLKDIKKITGNIAMDVAIRESGGNLQVAARKLKVSDRTLQAYESTKVG